MQGNLNKGSKAIKAAKLPKPSSRRSRNTTKSRRLQPTFTRKMSMKMFNADLKQLQREQAAVSPNTNNYNYLRSEVSNRLMNRLASIKLPFKNVTILGNDQGGLLNTITERHINQKLHPFTPKPAKSSFMLEAPPSLDPNDPSHEPPLTQDEIDDTMEYFRRYSIPELQNVTIVDPSLNRLLTAKSSVAEQLHTMLPESNRFSVNLLPSLLTQVPRQPLAQQNQNSKQPDNVVLANDTDSNAEIVSNHLPAKTQLVLSNLSMHWENDLPTVFKTAHDLLEPNGAFVGAMIGGETLRELRSSILLAEMERNGGVSHHISPFAYTKDIGDLMTRSGFEMVSVDVDQIKIPYPDMFTLIEHIRGMGEGHAPWDPSPPMRTDTWIAANAIYQTLYRDTSPDTPSDDWLTCTVDVIMFIGWKSHESIVKPAKRGSASAKFGSIIDAPPPGTMTGSSPGIKTTTQSQQSQQSQQQQQQPAIAVSTKQEQEFANFFAKIDQTDSGMAPSKY